MHHTLWTAHMLTHLDRILIYIYKRIYVYMNIVYIHGQSVEWKESGSGGRGAWLATRLLVRSLAVPSWVSRFPWAKYLTLTSPKELALPCRVGITVGVWMCVWTYVWMCVWIGECFAMLQSALSGLWLEKALYHCRPFNQGFSFF